MPILLQTLHHVWIVCVRNVGQSCRSRRRQLYVNRFEEVAAIGILNLSND